MLTSGTPTDGAEPKGPEEYNVVLMTAVVLKVMATSPVEAAQVAVATAPTSLSPADCTWVARAASTDPIEIAEPGQTEEDFAPPPPPVIEVPKPDIKIVRS